MLDPWYITGLTDGEGSFTYSRTKQTNTINLIYAIELNIDDLSLLQQVQEFFGCGKIYFVKPTTGAFKNPDYISRARAYYRITKIAELFKVLAHFNKYPLPGKKAKAYKIWEKMVLFKVRMYRHEMPQMLALAAALSKANGPGGRGKPLLNIDSGLVPKAHIPDFQYDHESRYYDPTARYE